MIPYNQVCGKLSDTWLIVLPFLQQVESKLNYLPHLVRPCRSWLFSFKQLLKITLFAFQISCHVECLKYSPPPKQEGRRKKE